MATCIIDCPAGGALLRTRAWSRSTKTARIALAAKRTHYALFLSRLLPFPPIARAIGRAFKVLLTAAVIAPATSHQQAAHAQTASVRDGAAVTGTAREESCKASYQEYVTESRRDDPGRPQDWYLEDARRILSRCSAVNPNAAGFPPWLPQLLANASLGLGDTARAVRYLDNALAVRAKTVSDSIGRSIVAYTLADLLYRQGRMDSASTLWWRFGLYRVYPANVASLKRFNVTIAPPTPSLDTPRQNLQSTFDPEPISRSVRRIQQAAGALHSLLEPSVRFDILVQSCESPSYSYDPNQRAIILCYDFEDFARRLAGWDAAEARRVGVARGDSATLERTIDGFLIFAILHEVGHALIHQMHIPALGNQEDVADGFASLALLNARGLSGSVEDVRAASDWLLSLEAWVLRQTGDRLRDYAAVHPFPGQRSARLHCLAIGALLEVASTAASMERRCHQEWARLEASWRQLLRTR